MAEKCGQPNGTGRNETDSVHVSNVEPDPMLTEALHKACARGNVKRVRVLLEGGANPNQINKDGKTALFIASSKGHERVVNVLLESGSDVDIQTKDGETALLISSYNGHKNIVQRLITAGAKLDTQDNDGETALFAASSGGHERVVEVLLESVSSVDIQNKDGETALLISSLNGHDNIVRQLITAGAKLDTQDNDGQTALFIASKNGHKKIVDVLLESGSSVDIQDKCGRTALWTSSYRDHELIVQRLIKAGAKLDTQNDYGQTPLYIASNRGHQRVVEVLLESGSDVDIKDQYGQTALYIASNKGHQRVVEVLLESGCNVDIQDRDGQTALYTASSKGHERVVEVLLQSGSCVDIQDNRGRTALKTSSFLCHKNIVQRLITAGAKFDFHQDELSDKERSQSDSQGRHKNTALKEELKFSSFMTCENLVAWLKQNGIPDKDLQLLKNQRINGEIFLSLPSDEQALDKKLRYLLTFTGKPKLVQLIKEAHDSSINSDLKFSRDFDCKELATWLEQKNMSGTALQLIRDQQIDGVSFLTLPTDKKGLVAKLGSPISYGAMCRLVRLITEANKEQDVCGEISLSQAERHCPESSQLVNAVISRQSTSQSVLTITALQSEFKLTNEQMDCPIEKRDFFYLGELFGHWKCYAGLPGLGLSAEEQHTIHTDCDLINNRMRSQAVLNIWQHHNPLTATFCNLLKIVLVLNEGGLAKNICQYVTSKSSSVD